MEKMNTDWSDKRLDDLKESVDEGFKEVKGSIDRVDGRIDALHRTMVVGFLSLAGLIIACFSALVTFFGNH
jgi:hypothetical protein